MKSILTTFFEKTLQKYISPLTIVLWIIWSFLLLWGLYEAILWLREYISFWYALITWLILTLIALIWGVQNSKDISLNTLYRQIMSHKDWGIYGGFTLAVLVVLSGVFFESMRDITPWIVALWYVGYIFYISQGAKISYTPKIARKSDGGSLRMFLISLALYMILLSMTLVVFDVTGSEKLWFVLVWVGVYGVIGYLIFFAKGFSTQYTHILSAVGIAVLIGSLYGVHSWFGTPIEPIQTWEISWQQSLVSEITGEPIITTQNTWQTLEFVWNTYELPVPLSPWDSWEDVTNLQTILQKLGYYNSAITGEFDEATRQALRATLMRECDWPESTQGILGPQALSCLNDLQIYIP